MPKQPVTPGGKKLRELREQARMTQQEIEGEAELGFGYLQRLELGKVSRPKRETLERILTTLNASYNDRYEVLSLFGYMVSTPLPTDKEIEWAIQVSKEHLQRCPYPVYLLDCAYRIWAWNAYVPRMIGQDPDGLRMKGFQGKCVVELIFDEQHGIAALASNSDETFTSLLLTFRAALYPYQEEEWCKSMTAKVLELPLFKAYWDQTERYLQSINMPIHPATFFHIGVPGKQDIQFRVLSIPFSQDRRFLIIEYIPFDGTSLSQ